MNIDHLWEFVYLAETLSFSITAQHFFLSASVLSKHIASMEEDLDVKLFERDRRHVELTEEGRKFYRDIVEVLAVYDRALENIEAGRSNRDLTLRIGYLRNAARPFLPKFVHYMEAEYPNVSLDINCMEYSHLIRAHRTHQVDVLLTMDLDPEAKWACDSEPIYQDLFYVVVGREHPLASKTEGVNMEDLGGQKMILPVSEYYPGMAERFYSFLPQPLRETDASFYKDIDTLFLNVEMEGRIGFSSGHNLNLFADKAVFLPLLDADTSYDVSAQWLKGMSGDMVAIIRDAARMCREYMGRHSVGKAGSIA